MPGTILDYRNPPINEVAIGVQFARVPQLLPAHIGLFWNSVRGDFPTCQHATPILGPDGQPWTDVETGLPLPRVWLVHRDDTVVMQFQNDRFLMNWRRRGPADEYPRFPGIKQRFVDLYTRWSQFLSSELRIELTPTIAELNYINAISKSAGWTWKNLGQLLPDFQWRQGGDRFLSPPDKLLFQFSLPIVTGEGMLTVKMNPATRLTDGEEMLRLELQTQRPLTSDSSLETISAWFDVAREHIVRGFADLTNEDIQLKVWGRESRDV